MGVRNDVTEFARLDGDTGERDRLCRFHRHRDLAQIMGRKIERQALVRTQISKDGTQGAGFNSCTSPSNRTVTR